jgi:hypothetical protein
MNLILNCAAKVECDFATEKYGKIIASPKSSETPINKGLKNFFHKKCD